MKTFLKNLLKNHTVKNHSHSKKSSYQLDFLSFKNHDDAQISIDAYKTNVVVHRCVSLIATAASHVPWQIFHTVNGSRELIKNHPAMHLLKNPSHERSGADFFIENLSHLLLYGESYMLLLLDSNTRPASLHNLHPSMVEQVISAEGKVLCYEYSVNDTKKRFAIDPMTKKSRVLHLRNYNPTNQHSGLSALASAAKAINIYAKIMDWNNSLLKNAIKPSGALIFQDGNGYLTDEQFERLQQQFYENFSGSANSGKPLILEGGLKWQETSHTEKFEKFIELKDSVARDIAIAFNVPPQLLGINGDNTYSNMQEARLALWEENIIPLLDKYSDALSGLLSYWYNDSLTVDFDKESISALTERREGLWVKIANAHFMTVNEKRAFVGLSPIQGGDHLT